LQYTKNCLRFFALQGSKIPRPSGII